MKPDEQGAGWVAFGTAILSERIRDRLLSGNSDPLPVYVWWWAHVF